MEIVKKVLVLFLIVNKTLGLNKHWLPNQEWLNPNNWIEGRVPDLDSHIIFPLEMRHVAGLPVEGELRISEIDLPADGALVLPKNGGIQISENWKKNEKVGTWSREGQLFWADPQNWNSTSEAVPHLERLPCQMDFVVLPGKDRVFNMILPMKEIQVKGVFLDKDEIILLEWYQRLKGREFSGRKQSVSYSELLGCERCLCQQGKQIEYLEEVCDIQRPRCGYQSCEKPLKVEGHCCHYCGARLSLSKKVYTPLVNRLTNEALNSYGGAISWYVRTTWDGNVEILIAENGQYSGIRIQEASRILESYLKEEGIEVLKIENSGEAIERHKLLGFVAPIFGGLFFALVFILIIFPIYGYSYSQLLQGTREIWLSIRENVQKENSKDSYGFARFENLPEGGVQLTGSRQTKEEEEEGEGECSSGGRFENPLYRSRRELKKVEDVGKIDFNSPVSLITLKNKIESNDDLEEMEIAMEEISETEH